MNYFNKSKWFTVVMILLVALNVATLSAFWLVRGRRQPPPPKTGAVDFLVAQLGLDPVQRQKLAELNNIHQQNMRGIRGHNREAKDSFFSLLQRDTLGDAALAAAARASVRYEELTDINTFRYFQQVRQLCNDEQKKRFDHVLQEVLRMSAPHEGPPPPGGRPGPPGPPGPPGRQTGRTSAAITHHKFMCPDTLLCRPSK